MTPTDDAGVLDKSRQEERCYEELLGVYRELVAALADAARPLDRDWLLERHAAAETVTVRLRALSADLAPRRLGGGPVAPEVAALWRRSAALAAEASRTNADATALARARQTALLARIAQLNVGRRALASYRPVADVSARVGHRA